jgi:hypothetical protein
MSTEVLSIRVKRELKREAERLNLDIRSIVENALAIAIERARRERLEKSISMLLLDMEGVSESEWIRAVRECRKER